MKKTLQKLSELVMFKHSIFSLPFIFIAMVVAKWWLVWVETSIFRINWSS